MAKEDAEPVRRGKIAGKLPPPPVIAGTFSGFVVGIVLTLVVSGVVTHTSNGSLATATPVSTVDPGLVGRTLGMTQKVRNMIVKQLGPWYTDPRKPRLVNLALTPAVAPGLNSAGYRTITFTFRLNDHPLGKVWRLRAAEGDIFEVLHSLYTSGLPVYSVGMIGIFPLPSGKTVKERIALRAYMKYVVASKIPWTNWGRNRDTEARLWQMLSSVHVDHAFA
jgi:hypothetical protein